MVDIGQRIKDLLGEKNITKAELARRLGVIPQAISRNLGKPSMNTDTLQKIMAATGIKAQEVFEESPNLDKWVSKEVAESYLVKDSRLDDLNLQYQLCKKDVERCESIIREKEFTIKKMQKTIDANDRTIALFIKGKESEE